MPVTFFWLPNAVTEAIWLSDKEKAIMAARLERNRGVYDASERFSWAEIIRALKDWKLYTQYVVVASFERSISTVESSRY